MQWREMGEKRLRRRRQRSNWEFGIRDLELGIQCCLVKPQFWLSQGIPELCYGDCPIGPAGETDLPIGRQGFAIPNKVIVLTKRHWIGNLCFGIFFDPKANNKKRRTSNG